MPSFVLRLLVSQAQAFSVKVCCIVSSLHQISCSSSLAQQPEPSVWLCTLMSISTAQGCHTFNELVMLRVKHKPSARSRCAPATR